MWLWVRSEVRGRWRAWLGVVLLMGFAGGAALAAVAGARHTTSSFQRFGDEAAQSHAVVFAAADADPFAPHAVDVELPRGTRAGLVVALPRRIHSSTGAVEAAGPKSTEGLAGRAE